jgi:Asp-tRNA(Asn)/Glu-tRNA(Gln) amidotransferase A subunit family amidase
MPVGLQLIARGGDDEQLVTIACAAERVLGTPRERLGTPPMCKA